MIILEIGKPIEIIYLISNPTVIDNAATKIKFKTSNNFSESKVIIKKIGKENKNANFLVRNIFNVKKKKVLISIFINNIMARFVGGIFKANKIINPKLKSRKINFCQYFPVACNICINYNKKLWLKLKQKNPLLQKERRKK